MRHGRFAACHCWFVQQFGFATAIICSLSVGASAVAQSSSTAAPPAGVAATPEQDDATLHDVTFVGFRIGFAVGERGVV